jgi:predicted DNA-binding ribbon-helix-helix protein
MTTLTLDNSLVNTLSEIAANEHKTVEQLFDEWVEDYLDKKAAERALLIREQLNNGEMETVSWSQLKGELDAMDS